MEAIAKTKNLKGSPRKARLVIDLIRGRNVSQALSILKFTDKRAADPIAKTLRSAIANATFQAEQQNIAIDPDDLWVKACFVDMGPHKNRRRMRPAPQGRAYREQRHYCHITIEVSSEDKPKTEKELKGEAAKAKRAAEGAPKKKAAAKKAEAPKKEKKAAKPQAEEVETPAVEAAEASLADAPAHAETAAKGDAEVADAKNIETQTSEALNETKPADERQLDTNEELERQ
jgi:large subunit ribosomal protein L22